MHVTSLNLPPPRCLTAVRTTKADADLRARFVAAFVSDEKDDAARARHEALGRAEPWISVRDELEVFSLGCNCGSDEGKLFGVRTDDRFCSPVRLACTKCDASTVIFDPKADGWDAESAKRKSRARKEPKMTFAMHCRGCKNTLWRPAAIVTYKGDNYANIPPERTQDYFDAIVLGGECVTCNEVSLGLTEECA